MPGGGDPISYNEAHFDQQGNKKQRSKREKPYLSSLKVRT
jgi:hypothetical protein